MLRAAAHSLHRCPHVAVTRQEIPTRWGKIFRFDPPGFIDALHRPAGTIVEYRLPHYVAIATDHSVGAAQLMRLFGIQGRVNAAEDHPSAARACLPAYLVSAQGIAVMNADAHDVAGFQSSAIRQGQSFIHDHRIAEASRGGRGQYV